ncbi:MAG: LamG domain-containing protein [Myxococcota bacterium]
MNTTRLRHLGASIPLVTGLAVASCTPGTFEIPLSSTSSSSTTGPTTGLATEPSDTEPIATTSETDPEPGPSSGDTSGTCTPIEEMEGDEGWWDDKWLRRRMVEIDTSIFPGAVSNVPVLLRMDASSLGPTWSERGGADLRVRAADDGGTLDYEIDDVDADGQLFMWVKLPQLDPAAGSQTVWLYYDNARADPWLDSDRVWTGFISVHHLGSDLDDAVGGHDGKSQWEPELCDGRCGPRVGIARDFVPELAHEVVLDGEQDFDLGNDPYQPTINFTVSVWMRSSLLADYGWGGVVAKGDSTWRLHTTDLAGEQDERIALAFDCYLPTCAGIVDPWFNYNVVGYDPTGTAEDDINDGAWHYVVTTFEDVAPPPVLPAEYLPTVQVHIYIDGALVAASPELEEVLIWEDDQPVRFGHNINGAERFAGTLDEVRIMTGVRSPDEIAADYLTVVEDHVAVGEEQQICP